MLIRLKRKNKAQSTAEYAILLGVVIGAAVAMQVYVKRGVMARIHEASKALVNQTENLDTIAGHIAAEGLQYEPYYLNSYYETNRWTNSSVTLDKPGNVSGNETTGTTRKAGGFSRYGFSAADADR